MQSSSGGNAGRRLLQLPGQPQMPLPGPGRPGQLPGQLPGQQQQQPAVAANPLASTQQAATAAGAQSTPAQQVAAAGSLDSSTWQGSQPGVEVQLQVKTSSATAQLQLDHLQRASNNNELQSSLASQGALQDPFNHAQPKTAACCQHLKEAAQKIDLLLVSCQHGALFVCPGDFSMSCPSLPSRVFWQGTYFRYNLDMVCAACRRSPGAVSINRGLGDQAEL